MYFNQYIETPLMIIKFVKSVLLKYLIMYGENPTDTFLLIDLK